MRRTQLTATLLAIPLAAVACGTATSTVPTGGPGGPATTTTSGMPESARSFAASLLARVNVPPGAKVALRAPSKALDHLPESPSLSRTPVVIKKFWTIGSSATSVLDWLRANPPDSSALGSSGGGSSGGPGAADSDFLAFRATSLPTSMAIGEVYLAVVPTGPSTSALAAYALSLAQPPRPAAENVPLDLSKAVIAWSLAPGGTPAEKILTGPAAVTLARDFNAMKVDTSGTVHCPMMVAGTDIVVTFTADGHTWKADVPACPDISVTRDGSSLPGLAFGKAFLADVKTYAGHLPQAGPPHGGGVIPLERTPASH